jgi:hypothetical protein
MDEFSAGVQILLKRIESNPDEFQEHGKWEQITRAVFARSEGDRNDAWAVRALTDAEVKALHTGVIEIYRTKFDEFVMKNVLDEPEQEKHWAQNAMSAGGFRHFQKTKSTSLLTTAQIQNDALKILQDELDKNMQKHINQHTDYAKIVI